MTPEVEVTVGGPMPVRMNTTGVFDTVPCVLCNTQFEPHHRGSLFTTYNCWWVCDECGRRHASHAHRVLQELRGLAGALLVRQVSCREVEADGAFGVCPRCGVDFISEVSNAGGAGWMIVDAQSDRPLCAECAAAAPDNVRSVFESVCALLPVRVSAAHAQVEGLPRPF